jgi:hypothetical protein
LTKHVGLDPAQVEALGARQDGHRHLADLGGGEDELGVRRRLFQRLQQRVERRRRQHVHFVDDVDLVARLDRGVAHPVQQLAHLVDLGARGGVQFQHVHVPTFDDRLAVPAVDGEVDRRLVDGVGLVVQGAGQQAGGRGLAHPADAGQHEGVGDAAAGEGVGQRADHGLLADQVLERARTVFARQHGVGGVGVGRRFDGDGRRRDDGRNRRGFSRRRRAKDVSRVRVPLGGLFFPRRRGIGVEVVVVGHGSECRAPERAAKGSACSRGPSADRFKGKVETGRRPGAKLVVAAASRP